MSAHGFGMTGPVLRVAAISPDHQILMDQGGSSLQLPEVVAPSPFVVSHQSFQDRIEIAISDQLGLHGRLVAILDAPVREGSGLLLLAYATRDVGVGSKLDQLGLRWWALEGLEGLLGSQIARPLERILHLIRAYRLGNELVAAWPRRFRVALQFLEQRVAEDHGLFGWTQLLTGDNVGAVSTAQGILCYVHAGTAQHVSDRALSTLQMLQNADGGWPVRRALIGRSAQSITEGTLFSLWALTASGVDSTDSAVVQGVQWLELAQGSAGGWGSVLESPRPRVYPTAFAIRILSSLVPSSPAVREGVTWLRSAQNSDGGWGALSGTDPSPGRASTAVHTAHAVLALLAAGHSADDEQVDKAITYLDATLDASGSEPWPSTSEVEVIEKDAALDFRHFSTPWVLAALLEGRRPLSCAACSTALQWLLEQQHTLGYWSCVLTPGQEPIWATHDSLFALSSARQKAVEQIPELLIAEFRKSELEVAWTFAFSQLDQAKALEQQRRLPPSKWLYIWDFLLTFLVSLLGLNAWGAQINLSAVGKLVSSIGVALVAGFVPFLYQLAVEEFKARRVRNETGSPGG